MSGHQVLHTSDAGQALAATAAYLAEDPVGHNVVLTIMQERAAHPEPGRYWWVNRRGRLEGVALQSPLDNSASVTPMPVAAVDALIAAMAPEVPDLPGIIGEATTASAFAGRWTEHTGVGAEPLEGQRLYRLASLHPSLDGGGHLRRATADEIDLLVSWWHGLAADIGESPPGVGGNDVLARRVAQGEIWLWDDGLPVSMARLSAPAAGAVRVGFVYTPPQFRRRGYAGASVAALSARALADGARECLLYTQLSNPTSNGIYRRIGYEAVSEVLSYRFQPR
ncbi:MAG TPA: GNAT family N-acetyltransferase [Acidimicrobiales bacterium]